MLWVWFLSWQTGVYPFKPTPTILSNNLLNNFFGAVDQPKRCTEIAVSRTQELKPTSSSRTRGPMLKLLSMGPRVREDDVNYCNFESRFPAFCLSPTTIWRFKLVKIFIRDSNARTREPNLCAQWIGTSHHFACKWGPRFRALLSRIICLTFLSKQTGLDFCVELSVLNSSSVDRLLCLLALEQGGANDG